MGGRGRGKRRKTIYLFCFVEKGSGRWAGKPFTIPEGSGYKQTPTGNEKGELDESIAHSKVLRKALACYQGGQNS